VLPGAAGPDRVPVRGGLPLPEGGAAVTRAEKGLVIVSAVVFGAAMVLVGNMLDGPDRRASYRVTVHLPQGPPLVAVVRGRPHCDAGGVWSIEDARTGRHFLATGTVVVEREGPR
jgi:hypothetical protein